MSSNKGIFKNQVFSAVLMVVLAVVVLAGYQLTRKEQHTAKKLTTPVAMNPIDSSNCIACHTSEGIIGAVVMETDEGHGGEGG